MFKRLQDGIRASITGVEGVNTNIIPSQSSGEAHSNQPEHNTRPVSPNAIHNNSATYNISSPKPRGPNPQQQRGAPSFLPPFLRTNSTDPDGRPHSISSNSRAPQSHEIRAADNLTRSPKPVGSSGGGGGFANSYSDKSPHPQYAQSSPSPFRNARNLTASAIRHLAAPPLARNTSGSTGDDPSAEDLAQRDSLEYQVRSRDNLISKLQHDLHRLQTQLTHLQKDHAHLRRQQLESTHRQQMAIQLWKRTNEGLKARVECFAVETTPEAAQEIASLIRDAAPNNKDSSYLMMLQEQLNKATIKLDHLSSQTEIVLHKGEEVVESLREEMNEVIRERSRMEIELLDQKELLEEEKMRMVKRVERVIWMVESEIKFLEKKAVENFKNEEEEDDGGDEKERQNQEHGEANKEDDDRYVDTDNSSPTPQDKPAQKPQSQTPNQPTPEELRQQLHRVTMEKDRRLSDLRNALRKKNEEFHSLMKLKENRERIVRKMEEEKRDREEWERSRGEGDLFYGMEPTSEFRVRDSTDDRREADAVS